MAKIIKYRDKPKGTTIVFGYQFEMDRSEMLRDTEARIFLNDKFLGNKLTWELIESINRVYGFIGPLCMKVRTMGMAMRLS